MGKGQESRKSSGLLEKMRVYVQKHEQRQTEVKKLMPNQIPDEETTFFDYERKRW